VELERPHTRDFLSSLLWPNISEKAARNNLRRVLANLRSVIHDRVATPAYLTITRQTLQFNATSHFNTDVAALLQLPEKEADYKLSIENLEKIVELYQGPFLEGFSILESNLFEEWLGYTRGRLHRKILNALNVLINRHEQLGKYNDALNFFT
jgi:DNA-binding SARP family transcriptional activator